MSNYSVKFTVGAAGPFDAELEGVELDWVSAVFEDKAVVNSEGAAVLNEDGSVKTEKVMVSGAHFEDEGLAVLKALREAVEVDEFEKNELTEASVTIEYRISGSVTHYLSDYDLTDISSEDELQDAIDSGQFEDEFRATILEDMDEYAIDIEDVSIDSVS